MGSHTVKVKRELELVEVAHFLREMADMFEGRQSGLDGDAGLPLQDFHKIEIKMKRQMTAVSLKMKIEQDETAEEEASADGQNKPNYKKLKKQMQETYKTIRRCLSDKRLPDELTIQSFMRDALIMVSYPDYGDEYYEAFAQACQRFSQACETRDLEMVRGAFAEIVQIKEDCHDRHK